MRFQEKKWLPLDESRIMRGDKSQGKEAAMNDSTAAYRLREQLKRFVGIGCNEIFMQSQRGLAAENAKDARLMPRSRPASGP